MIWALRIYFILVLVAMTIATTYASLHTPIWQIPPEVGGHPWFITTLFDTYFAFLIFYFWVFYKETSVLSRILWLLGILLLGNFAMAAYMLIILFRVPTNATAAQILLRRSQP